MTKPYSIQSSPRDALDGKYVITVKHAEGGFASEYILQNWREGEEVCVSGPVGDFTYEPLRDAGHVVGLAPNRVRHELFGEYKHPEREVRLLSFRTDIRRDICAEIRRWQKGSGP